jgi:hypothetical protein
MVLFGKPKPKTPFYDLVANTTIQAAAAYMDGHEKTPKTLGVVITLMNFNAIQNLIKPDKVFKGAVKLSADVFAFEAALFGLYATRLALEPQIDPDDWDDDEDFDEDMDEVWKTAYAMLVSLADKNCGWDTEPTFKRRMMRYMHLGDLRKATDEFIGTLNEINDTKVPMPKYPGPMSLDLKQTLALMTSVNSFAVNLPEGCAESLRRIMQHYGYAK